MTIATSEPRGSQLNENGSRPAASLGSARLNSCFYEGVVRHRRLSPIPHAFRNPLFLMFIDLDEIVDVFAGRFLYSSTFPSVAQFCRRDFHGDPTRPLVECVRETVLKNTGQVLTGPIRLLTHVRYLGFVFNPVSVYYCYDETGQRVEAVVAEVTNTPWGERHCYVIPADGSARTIRFECPKEFHVSPFLPIDLMYRWRVSHPGERAAVRLECHNEEARVFDATLILKRREFTLFNRLRSIVRFPVMTLQVVIAIYWQAVRLWLKKAPFFPHPAKVKNIDLQLAGGSDT